MQDDIRLFILALLARKAPLPKDFDDNSDFLAAGIIDSMAVIKFILELESKFDVAFDDEDIESDRFRSVRGLTAMIADKVA